MPSVSVAVNRLKTDPEVARARIRKAGREPTTSRFFPEMLILENGGNPADLPGFADGLLVPMDEGGALPVHALDLAPGQRVLDACAGGGGKTALIAGALGGTGEVVALDQSPRAIRRLSAASARLGLATVQPTIYDARGARTLFPGRFDRVLLDAPCSGLGTVRRRPEIKWRRRLVDLSRLALLQQALLAGVAGALAPGGLLVYSTCSLEPEETDSVMTAFLANHPEFTLEPPPDILQPFREGMVLRAWPHRHGTDGFFVARLRKGT
jgi:16S rRNA (cytosine967-C5)-methyltransferase